MQLNKTLKDERIQKATDEAMATLQSNCVNGIDTTELLIDLDIASDVRSEITDKLDADKTNYEFCVVRRGNNQFTGRPESFTGETRGDKKYYKIRIF